MNCFPIRFFTLVALVALAIACFALGFAVKANAYTFTIQHPQTIYKQNLERVKNANRIVLRQKNRQHTMKQKRIREAKQELFRW